MTEESSPNFQNIPQELSREARMEKLRRRRSIANVMQALFFVFFLVFLGALGGIGVRTWQDHQEAKDFDSLQDLLVEPEQTQGVSHGETLTPNLDTPQDDLQEGQILSKYQKVYVRNQDLYGWISVDGLSLSYPVMYTPEDGEYYLRRNFEGETSHSGVPFVDGRCTPDGGNLILYGHNMKNGTMFSGLVGYADQSFWEEHPIIHFDTLYEMGEYEVFATFYSQVYLKGQEGKFRYYDYTDLRDPEVFSEFVDGVTALRLYDTGVSISYGDELITLITCSYTNQLENERFVVVARKIVP